MGTYYNGNEAGNPIGFGATGPAIPPTTPTDLTTGESPPTTPPQTGYVWQYDPTYGDWYQSYAGSQSNSQPTTPQTMTVNGVTFQSGDGGLTWSPMSQSTTGSPSPSGSAPTDPYGRTATWNTQSGGWQYPPDWGTDPKTQQSGYVSPAQQAQIDATNAQLAESKLNDQNTFAYQQAQIQAQKDQQLASLRAQPASWLEYASLSNTTPLVQPWMAPLSPDQYGWKGAQVGGAIPNWDATKSQDSLQGNLPSLTTPSAQYMSRIAPSAREQYYGYQQATTGATPADTQWQLWSRGAPSGNNSGVSITQ